MSEYDNRPISEGPIEEEPRYQGEAPDREYRRNVLSGWLAVSEVDLGAYDRRILEWAADTWDWATFATITSWIRRAGVCCLTNQED